MRWFRWLLAAGLVAGCEFNVGTLPKGSDTADETDETVFPPGGDDDDDATSDTDETSDPGEDLRAQCAGEHTGSYEGDQEGVARAELHPDGEMEMVFVNFIELQASGTVSPSGDVEGVGYGISVEGSYSFEDCSASGTWQEIGGDDNGTWVLHRD